MKINYHNKKFRSSQNSSNGEVDSTTLFHYSQINDIVTGTYSGLRIKEGQLIAKVIENGALQMRYQHLNDKNEFKYGHCISTPEILENGKIRLHEKWQWDCGDRSKGESMIEEV